MPTSNEPTEGSMRVPVAVASMEREPAAGGGERHTTNSTATTIGEGEDLQVDETNVEPSWKKLAQVHVHPEDHDTDDEDEFDDYDEKKFYFLFQYGMSMVIITALALSGSVGGWATQEPGAPDSLEYNATGQYLYAVNHSVRTAHGPLPSQAGYDLWSHCHCYPTTEEQCPQVRNFFLGGKIVSLVALGGELICVAVFALLYAGFLRRWHRTLHVTSCVLSYCVAVALLVSFAAFSSAYARTWCGEPVRKRGFVSWIYGLRITEFVVATILAVIITFHVRKRSKRFGKTFLFVYSVLWGSSIVSTVTRAWIQRLDGTVEIGLWQACECWYVGCSSERSFFEGMEAFTILAVIAMYLWMAAYFLHISKWTQFPLVLACCCFMVVPLVLFRLWHEKEFCGVPSASVRGYDVSWPSWVYLGAGGVAVMMMINLAYRWRREIR